MERDQAGAAAAPSMISLFQVLVFEHLNFADAQSGARPSRTLVDLVVWLSVYVGASKAGVWDANILLVEIFVLLAGVVVAQFRAGQRRSSLHIALITS